MYEYHIVSSDAGFNITCLYYGNNKENMVTRDQILGFGDYFMIGHGFKYIKKAGWFIEIIINKMKTEYVSLDSIEKAVFLGAVKSMVELEFELSILRHQLDKVLKTRNIEEFFVIAPKYVGANLLMKTYVTNS
ncbi:hypothetical protein [Litchfieldia alkalitelluris]|uniref:hypothetical protein n=1 Tax=Litchfieldia alkalitelluris TaxID=304268 RepID=UPI0009965319|nr:hypothetical protein [Litchfieldia alkalitelluris]